MLFDGNIVPGLDRLCPGDQVFRPRDAGGEKVQFFAWQRRLRGTAFRDETGQGVAQTAEALRGPRLEVVLGLQFVKPRFAAPADNEEQIELRRA